MRGKREKAVIEEVVAVEEVTDFTAVDEVEVDEDLGYDAELEAVIAEAEEEILGEAVAEIVTVDYDLRNRELARRRIDLKECIKVLQDKADLTFLEKNDLRKMLDEKDRVTWSIVDLNTPLVRKITGAWRQSATMHDAEDYEGAGMVGLMKAIDTYNPDKGKFSSFAYRSIARDVFTAVWSAEFGHMQYGDFEKRKRVKAAAAAYLEEKGEGAQLDYPEIAKRTRTAVATVVRILDSRAAESLAAPANGDGPGEIGDLIEDDDPGVEDAVVSRMTTYLLSSVALRVLPPRERFVLVRRFGLDGEPPEKLGQIGLKMGQSRETVRQAEVRALSRINHPVVMRALVDHRK